ncbi:MAG: sulfite exporter TauE/SafE family protein [Ruminococcaceae bacterium]|nr:sulfite exporter TauE/SafE family protein [Oscillospiraceae bacterium]
MELLQKLIFLCPLLFLAGVIDGISGGGGIIALPAYLMSGLPVHFAYGCNKMQSCIGTFSALVHYGREGYLDLKPSLLASVFAVIGSAVATRVVLLLSDSLLKIVIAVCMCFILCLTFFIRKITTREVRQIELSPENTLRCLTAGLLLGLYDGFFGPGGGTVALMLFALLFGYDVRTATGNGKVVIVVSNLIALVHYIVHKSILFEIAVPATLFNVLGCRLGAKLAVKNGKKLVGKMLLGVVALVVVQALIKLV